MAKAKGSFNYAILDIDAYTFLVVFGKTRLEDLQH